MTPTDALREMAAECERALAVRKTTVGAKWCLERCRAALTAAEKDESELVAALKSLVRAWDGSVFGTVYEMKRAIPHARAILAKHADPPKE